MNPQLAGLDDLEGTYIFDLRASHKALKLNRFLWSMIAAPARERYLADEEAAMTESGLSEKEKALLRARDWLGLVQNGATLFVMEKFARVVRKTNLEVYALMRGETFDEFMATRRVPDCR